jgi:N6-L-threonylcarbamoyladenine synthase
MNILGLETSCDETAVAIVGEHGTIFAERLRSQTAEHTPFGGVVPEIAARSHLAHLPRQIAEVMAESGLHWRDIHGIAATAGPGLIGGVMVGLMAGKAIASAARLPFVAVNHLEGHALTARLTDNVAFPYALLLVSGGHCQFLEVRGVGDYRLLGATRDDALGEAFDKTAKMLGLPYPGGPALEQRARLGNAKRFALPRPMIGKEGCDMSFSGLKTAVRLAIAEITATRPLCEQDINDMAASFEASVLAVMQDRLRHALTMLSGRSLTACVVAGGVAANQALKAALTTIAAAHGLPLIVPAPRLCTDNAVMIAWAGRERLLLGQCDALSAPPRARWPLAQPA